MVQDSKRSQNGRKRGEIQKVSNLREVIEVYPLSIMLALMLQSVFFFESKRPLNTNLIEILEE